MEPWEIPDVQPVEPWDVPDLKPVDRFKAMLESGQLKPVNSDTGLGGVGQQFQKGLVQGVGGIVSTPARGGQFLAEKATQGIDALLGLEHQPMPAEPQPMWRDPGAVGDAIGNSTGIGDAQTRPEKYANTVGQFIPGLLMGSPKAGLVPPNITPQVGTAITAGLGSEAAGQATEGSKWEPYARLAGALGGGTLPSMVSRLVTPFPMDAARKKIVDALKKEGIDLTAGQETGSKALRYAESELGGGKAAQIMEQQGEQFTSAALKKAGISASRATPDVVNDAFETLGKQFDDLASKSAVPFDKNLQDGLLSAVDDYQANAASVAPAAERYMNRAAELASQNGGVLSGEAYKNLRSEIGKAIRKSSDGDLKGTLREMQDVLDDAVERNLSGALLDQWKDVRGKYRNLMVIEKAATGAGDNAAQGLISPSQLRNATVQAQGRRNYARGKGDFADLARAGEATMKPLPDSGTASRTAVRSLGTGIPAVLGGILGGGASGGNPMGQIVGALLGAGAPYAAGRAILSGPGRKYLTNQLLATPKLTAAQRAIISAMGAGNQALKPQN